MIRAAGGATLGTAVLVSRMPSSAANAQASPVPIVPGADWLLALGNPARTGVAVNPGPEDEPELIWRFEMGLSGTRASPVIVDGMVLSMAGMLGSAALVALDLQTGELVSSVPVSFQPLGSAPAVADGVVYLAGLQGEVAAFDLATQEQLWSTTLDAGTTSSPLERGAKRLTVCHHRGMLCGYSRDLRERLLQAAASGLSLGEIERSTSVSQRSLQRWKSSIVAGGALEPGTGPGRTRMIGPEAEDALRIQLAACSDATLAEHGAEWVATGHPAVSVATMSRALARLGLPLQKDPDCHGAGCRCACPVAVGDRGDADLSR